MRTNPIGAGTCNLSINVRLEERALLRSLASTGIESGKFRSVGDFVRHLLLRGMESTDTAAACKLREVRNTIGSTVLLLLVCVGTVAAWLSPDDDSAMLRARRGGAVVRNVIRRAKEETV